MTTAQQRRAAKEKADRVRREIKDLKADIRGDYFKCRDMLMDPPECIHDWPLVEAICLCRSAGMRTVSMVNLGERALNDDVNLMHPVGTASTRWREWAVREGLRHVRFTVRPRPAARAGDRLPRSTVAVMSAVSRHGGRATTSQVTNTARMHDGVSRGAVTEALRRCVAAGMLVRARRGVFELPDYEAPGRSGRRALPNHGALLVGGARHRAPWQGAADRRERTAA